MAVVTGQALLLKGTNGLSILLGSGPPANTLGVDGQPGYLDTTNNLLYGPKVSGAWPTAGTYFGGNFILKSGAPASTDGLVNNLSLDINAGFIYGPKTSSGWPSQPLLSLVGPRGVPGPQGPSYTLPADLTANSLVLAPVAGNSNAVQVAIKNSAGTILWGVDTNGNEVVGGTLNVTGNATFNANVSAKVATVTGVTNSGNETIAGTLGVTGTTTLGSAKITQVTFNDGTVQTTAAVGGGSAGSRFPIVAGGFYSTNAAANGLYTLEEVQGIDASSSTSGFVIHASQKIPFAYSLTGWSINQYFNNGVNTFQVTKNRTANTGINNILTQTAGTTTIAGFAGNQFSGTWTKGTYNFAAGDTIGVVFQHSSGTSTAVRMTLYAEWL